MGRRINRNQLKQSYYRQAVRNLEATRIGDAPLFSDEVSEAEIA